MISFEGNELWQKADFDKLIEEMSVEESIERHRLRYAMFRCQTGLDSGAAQPEPEHVEIRDDLAKKLKKAGMEVQEPIEASFARQWDIGKPLPKPAFVYRHQSIWRDWKDTLLREVDTLPREILDEE